jgi:hypothetical protein
MQCERISLCSLFGGSDWPRAVNRRAPRANAWQFSVAQSLINLHCGGNAANSQCKLWASPRFHFITIHFTLVHVLELFISTVDRVLSWAFDMDTSVYKDAHGDCLSLASQSAADPSSLGGDTSSSTI